MKNSLQKKFPEIAKEWDYNKNEIKPDEISSGSHKNVWWIHKVLNKNGEEVIHNWKCRIDHRTLDGSNCPYCSNQKILKGYNDLLFINPELCKEWDYSKNKINPDEVSSGSNKKVWWIHKVFNKDGKEFIHSWEAEIYRRHGGVGCPYCANKKIQKGFNDLKTLNPELAKEWNKELNELKPTEVTVHSNKKVHWICPKGHPYEARINDRTSGDNCPECSKRLRTSLPEKTIYFYIKQVFPDAISGYKDEWLDRKELDIYIPSLKLAIEYDGQKSSNI